MIDFSLINPWPTRPSVISHRFYSYSFFKWKIYVFGLNRSSPQKNSCVAVKNNIFDHELSKSYGRVILYRADYFVITLWMIRSMELWSGQKLARRVLPSKLVLSKALLFSQSSVRTSSSEYISSKKKWITWKLSTLRQKCPVFQFFIIYKVLRMCDIFNWIRILLIKL